MDLRELFVGAESEIVVLGTVPLSPYLEQSAPLLLDLLERRKGLRISVLHESDSELFGMSLCTDTPHSSRRMSYGPMRVAGGRVATLYDSVAALMDEEHDEDLLSRLTVRQVNLRLPISVIATDEHLRICPVLAGVPDFAQYEEITPGHPWHEMALSYLDFYRDPGKGGIYLSERGDELLEMYDAEGIPRGIFPRTCFYNTEFQRYSVWGFVFNRSGQLLLHRRSSNAKDNRSLWDKSIGGHKDLRDSSTTVTAERELIEELFMSQAEFTPYVQENLRYVINLGDWRPPSSSVALDDLRRVHRHLPRTHWVYYRAPDHRGQPMTLSRTSTRRYNVTDSQVEERRTKFRSDVFLFVAGQSMIEDQSRVDDLLSRTGPEGAASERRLLTVAELREWIESEGEPRAVFTDDLLYMMETHRELLESFAEFVRACFPLGGGRGIGSPQLP